jgi:hypothetical protein
MPGVMMLEENTLPVLVLNIFCDLFFLLFLLRVSAVLTMGGIWSFSCRPLAAAACWDERRIPFLGTLLVQVTANAPQAAGRLLAVFPDVAELVAFMTMCKTILSSICLYPGCDVAVASQSENSLVNCVIGKTIRKRGSL